MMEPLIQTMANDSGLLREVEYFYDEDLPSDISAIKLIFQHHTYVVVVVKDDDSLELVEDPTAENWANPGLQSFTVSHQLPWRMAKGRMVRWAWTLVNQQGYLDGLQFEFANHLSQSPLVVQLTAMASRIEVNVRINLNEGDLEFLTSIYDSWSKPRKLVAVGQRQARILAEIYQSRTQLPMVAPDGVELLREDRQR